MTRMLPLAALALACALSSPAFAEEVAGPATALVLPVNDWLLSFLAAVVPAAVALIAGAISVGVGQVTPWAKLFLFLGSGV